MFETQDIRRTMVAIALCLTFLGCNPDPPPQADVFAVRLMTSLPLSGPWELAAEQGLGRIAGELDAEVRRIRCSPKHMSQALQQSTGAGTADLIYCVGPGFENATFTEAVGHPDLRFVVLPGVATGANVASIDFVADGAAYLGGVVAATLSRGSTVGVIRGAGRPWLEAVEEGFVAGFRSRRNRGETVTSSGADAPWELVRAGAEIALYATDRPDAAVLAAAHNAGLLLIAVDSELLSTEPDVVIATISLDVGEAMLRVAREVRDGNFRGRIYAFDLGSGVVDLKLNPLLDVVQAPEVLRSVEEARAEVTAGLVEVEALGI